MAFESMKLLIQEKDAEISRLKQLLYAKESEHDSSFLGEKNQLVSSLEPSTCLTKDDIGRYSRQLILPEFGVQGQIKLKNTSVLIVGAGGLGCPAAVYLAAAGIGRLGVVDYDEVELSNLHRQILHTSDRVGVSKSVSISRSCFRLNSCVEYVPYQVQLSSNNALDIISGYDIVVDATDNVATRYLLNDACVLAGKVLVSGSALRFEGQLTVYNCDGGPCYRCLFPQPPPPESVTNCSEGGVIGVVPGIIGSMQALEVIKIASGIGTSYSQRLLLFDALDGAFRTIKLRPRSPTCNVCGDHPTVTQLVDYVQFCGAAASDKERQLSVLDENSRISAREYQAMLADGVKHVLVDVRPAVEMEICRLPHDALNIPGTSLAKDTPTALRMIVERLGVAKQQHAEPGNEHQCQEALKTESEQEQKASSFLVVCVCRRGNDSQKAVQRIKEEICHNKQEVEDTLADLSNVRVVDIKGGLSAWAKHVDKNFPLY